MEDFGYQKDDDNEQFSAIARKVLLAAATVISLALFVYITVNAYYYVYYDKDNDVEVIKGPDFPIKEIVESEVVEGAGSAQMHSIYQDIFGNGREEADVKNAKIRKNPEPVSPSASEVDRRLIKGTLAPEKKSENIAAVAPQAPTQQPAPKIVENVEKKIEQPAVENSAKKNEGELANAENVAANKKERRRPIRVQVAAMNSQSAAKDYWQKISNANSSLFSGLKPYVEQVDLGKRGIFFRLQIGNFFNQVDAEEFCSRYVSQIKKSRADCIIVE